MAPPTGVSDSIIVVRRNGSPFESYYGALSSPVKNFPMEGNERFRKTWGERWKANKSGKRSGENQMIESSNFMVHPDYLHKYGTLSNGILTKSIKHADTYGTWYGTVGVRGSPTQRPSLFLYPGVVAPAPRIVNQSTYITSPGAFLTPSPQNRPLERNGYMITQPRKQNDQRFSGKQNEFNFHECRDCRNSIRPGACLTCKKTEDKRNGTCKGTIKKIRPSLRVSVELHDKRNNSNSLTDPYNLMRKNRLAINEGTENSALSGELSKKKTKITGRSSLRGQHLESVTYRLETFKPNELEKEVKNWLGGEEDWHNEEEVIRRKSILECDLNVYELNKSTKKLGDDEDYSDEFTEGSIKAGSKLKILRPKLNKTEVRKNVMGKSDSENIKSQSESVKNAEIRLNGQKFKIFDHSSPSTSIVEGYVSDDNENKKSEEATTPRLTSPKRPPRKPKDKVLGEIIFRHSKTKSKSSPNLSIKSILKKPTGVDDLGATDLSVYHEEMGGKTWSEPQTMEFTQKSDLTIIKQTQNTIKKKKQVQFRVNNSFESLNKITQVCGANVKIPEENCDLDNLKETEIVPEPVQRSKSCENLLFTSETVNECLTTDEIKNEEINSSEQNKYATNGQSTFGASDDILNEVSSLRRSQSERRSSSSRDSFQDDLFSLPCGPLNSFLFSDTMALRTRTTKQDARKILFGKNHPGIENYKSEEKLKRKNSPSEKLISTEKSDDKAQTTFHNLQGNLISYASFSDLVDTPQPKDNGVVKRSYKKTRLSTDSYIPVKIKSVAPKPPSRRVSSVKNVKAKIPETISVKVSSKGSENTSICSANDENFEKEDNSSNPYVCLGPGQTVPESGMEATDGKIIVKCKTTTVEDVGASKVIIQPQRKTSILINNFHPQDTNKVTINVRNESSNDEPNSSSCTIIETGSNSTVIPVVSTDNKTTLIVGSSTSVTSSNVLDEVCITKTSPPQREETSKAAATSFPASEQAHQSTSLKCDSSVELLDPVEAVRRNLVPHVCGKEENDFSLLGKIKQLREAKAQKSLAQISQLFENASASDVQTSEISSTSCTAKKCSWKNISSSSKSEEESSTNTSRSNSFCSTNNSSVKNSSTSTSRSSSFRSSCCKSVESDYDLNQVLPSKSKFYFLSDVEDTIGLERDKLEYEYEVRNGFKEDKKEDCENIYETIKEEPIYDQIGLKTDNEDLEDDIPPPLPLTLPPSLDEIDIRSPKSIFEGASKYDILNYLVDAKDRVQEECYFSGSSTSEDVDSKKLNSLEDSEKKDNVPGIELSSSEGLDLEQNLRRMDRSKSKFVESESGLDLSRPVSIMSHIRGDSEDSSILSTVTEKESFKLSKRTSAEVERNDSGVGSETSHTSRSKWQVSSSIREDAQHLCEDCDQVVETQVTDGGVMYAPLICRKCSKRRSERKEIIQEIVDTEEKYGRDLKIILEEFYTPMLVAGLLTPDQLAAIFLNTEELVENSEQLTEKLKDTLEIALEQGDEDLLTVNIGKLFLDAGPMLHAFESYCTRQGAAAVLLATLEKEKELLRIFLRVSQMENTVLRRMNLNSFLMVPVQRVTKYPLLLARLYKVTPPHLEGRELLKEAQHNIELHLEHMNSEAKDVSTTKVWRRFSSSTASGRKTTAELEMINIKLRKMAVDVLEWNHEEVRFVMEGKLLYTQPTDNNWKKGRTIKLNPIFVLLVTLGKPNSKYKMDPPEDELTFPTKTGVREATLLLVKEKCGRYTLIREPLFLDKIIVCCETDADEYFEIQELSTKDSFIFKAEDGEKTKEWYRHLQYHAQILGAWRKRRNALANIMINGMTARAYTS